MSLLWSSLEKATYPFTNQSPGYLSLIVNNNFRSECQVFKEAGMKEEVFKLSYSIARGEREGG